MLILLLALLEQPSEWFNKEIIESYVSEIHEGIEYDLKQELAEELIKGRWSIIAKVNGIDTQFQLMPIDEIRALQNILNEPETEKVNIANTDT